MKMRKATKQGRGGTNMLPTWVDDAGMLVRGVNVRRDDAEREVWRPAGIPKTVREDSWVPLQEVELPGTGKCATFMKSGHTLGTIVSATDARGTDRLHGAVAAIGIITGEPLRFDVVTPGLVRVLMRHERTVYLTYRVTAGDGSPGGGIAWQNHGTMPEMPALSIVPTDETTLSEGFGAMSLSGTGATRGSLAPGDEKIVSDRVMNAYSRLKAQASATGFYIQPTLARCRMLDAAGDTIAVSPPVMIGATGGFQCTGDIKLTSSDGLATLGGGAVTARAYRIAIKGFTQMPQPWKRIVCRVIVEAVPQIDPVDTDGTCSTTISTNGATTTVAVRLAGLSGTAASNSLRERNLTVRALTAAPGCYMLQGSFPYPFDNPPAETRTGLREDATAYTAKSPGLIPRRDNISFGAAHETCGELVLADRRIEGFKGYPPAEYAVGRDMEAAGSYVAAICVEASTPDGNVVTTVSTSEGDAAAITALSPLLVFPDARATKLSITIAQGNEILTETYPLTGLPENGIAYYLAADMRPIFPRGKASQIILPEPTPAHRLVTNETGKVTVCHPLRTATPIAERRCSQGGIVAITDAPRSRSTWDFSRRKLLLFGERGTHILTLDSKSCIHSVAQLDNRPVRCREAVCRANGTNGMTLLAVAGGDLVEAGQSSVSTLLRNCLGERPGWCGRFNEIWLGGGDVALRRITSHNNRIEVLESDFGKGTADCLPLQWESTTLLTGGGKLLDTSEEVSPAEGMKIGLTTRHRPGAYLPYVRANLFAAKINGTLTIAGDNGTRISEPLMRANIHGALNSPLILRVIAPFRENIELRLDADASHDAEWHTPGFGLADSPLQTQK